MDMPRWIPAFAGMTLGNSALGQYPQKRMFAKAGGRDYLYRVVVDTQRVPPEVVTAYRTSKFQKYES
jgi:hypothetical protein